MTTVPYEMFLQEVLPFVRDCPQVVAVNAIRNACIEFCDQTHWLTYEPDAQSILPNTTVYEVEYETGVIPVRLVWAKVEGCEVRATFNPQDITVEIAGSYPNRVTNALTMKLAVRPIPSSTAVDKSLHDRWHEAVAHGALYRLYNLPGQPFTDPERGLLNRTLFRSDMADAKIEVQRDGTIGPKHVRMRQW